MEANGHEYDGLYDWIEKRNVRMDSLIRAKAERDAAALADISYR